MKCAIILATILIYTTPAFADETLDIALKAGSREALICYRQAEATTSYPANRLHQFGPCIRATDFGDETIPAEHIRTDMKHAAAYYLAVENFGRMTQRDYGTLGASEMRYLTDIGKIALASLEARGYGSAQICAILSWIECARFKTLPRK